ncbi:hypothetical protein NJC40_03560 [Pseudomonas sp. 21LCFQ02]|uniref:hypothetical protein n=1 Tax=unclassified Pseudomonas TaxID=196821 RepID=UPI002096DF23|nr:MULTISPECIES: hypothetical protein [unclassified Pseudomonas]MCO8161053.1 hypothetical protein [Pseudomonas sp. 21LCFQ010]MCO8166855.1 hypothetical protein [Pseudomonas sp. 21LCFQ02]
MSHQFKPGDFALITGSKSGSSPNVGRCVELVTLLNPGEITVSPTGHRLFQSTDEPKWIVQSQGLLINTEQNGWVDRGGIAMVSPRYLMPLRGDFTPEQQKSKAVPA